MRLNNKYKISNKVFTPSGDFHNRILNFKRPKWKKIQKTALILSSKKSKKIFNDSFRIQNNCKVWYKLKSYYKQGVKSRNSFYNVFDRSVGIQQLKNILKNKKNTNKKDIFMKCLVKPEYWIDILLWKLRFFNSSYEARQQIYNGVILLNNKNILGNVYLKSGDIITFKNFFKLNIELNNKYFLNNQKIYSFVEIDYYTNTIIIIKDFFELELNDLCLLNTESYYLKKIKDFC